MVLCYVKGCKYADFHITSFHKCGKCNNYGTLKMYNFIYFYIKL